MPNTYIDTEYIMHFLVLQYEIMMTNFLTRECVQVKVMKRKGSGEVLGTKSQEATREGALSSNSINFSDLESTRIDFDDSSGPPLQTQQVFILLFK